TDRMIISISNTGLFNNIYRSKLIALALLAVSLIGVKGKKDEKINPKKAVLYILMGIAIYLSSRFVLYIELNNSIKTGAYTGILTLGYILVLTGGTWLSRLIRIKLGEDIFNKLNESFPQEERL